MAKWLGLVVVVVLVLGGGYYYWQQSGVPTFDPNKPYAISDEVGGESSGATKGSLKALLAMGGAQECEVAMDTANLSNKSKVYVAGGKMRSDMVTSVNGSTVTAHVIVDGNTMYNWMDGVASGMKMSLEATASAGANNQAAVNLDQQVDYSCKPWTADSSKFTLPKGVTFTDLSAMLKGGVSIPAVN